MSDLSASHRLARLAFDLALRRDAGGNPRVPAEFVAEQGQHVRIVDVRDRAELLGALGHIPAVTSVPLAAVGAIPTILDPATMLVLVSGTGAKAAIAARYLEALGMTRVAALDGGMEEWRKLGFSTPRGESTVRWELKPLPPGVGRDGRPLVPAQKGMTLTAQQLLDHTGDPGAVRWVKLAAFLLHGKRSCVDGRDDKGVIGTPGGDAGEFVLALAAAEGLRGRAFADDEVERVLGAHLDTFGRFYMHSDTHAMNRLIVDGLRKDPRVIPHIERVWEPAEWRRFHQSPPESVREALLEHLVRPEHMGCGHLRFVMTDDRYSVRPGLVEAVLRAFHRLRWSGAPELEWVVLGGDHVEGAVMEVVLDTDLRAWSRIPLVSPQVDGLQSFVSHPQVTEYVRRGTAAFLAEIGAVDSAERLLPRICDLGAAQLGHTLRQLALGLPVFRLHFSADAEPGMRGEANPPRIEALGEVA